MRTKRLLAVILVATMMLSIGNFGIAAETEDNFEEVDIFEILTGLSDNYNSIDILLKPLTDAEKNTYNDMPMEFYDPEMLSEDEIDAIMERIASGENVRFGTPSLSSYWIGGGPDPNKTHQWLTANGFEILYNERNSVYNWFSQNLVISTAIQYSDWPDDNERNDFNSWHFFHFPTGTNYWGDYPTAQDRFNYWYNDALFWHQAGIPQYASRSLGCAIHYLSDVGAPPHTGDRASMSTPYMLIYHNQYEYDANNWKNNYRISSGGHYNFANTSLNNIIYNRAQASYSMYSSGAYMPTGNYSNYEISINLSLVWTQRDIAGLLYKFYMDCR